MDTRRRNGQWELGFVVCIANFTIASGSCAFLFISLVSEMD